MSSSARQYDPAAPGVPEMRKSRPGVYLRSVIAGLLVVLTAVPFSEAAEALPQQAPPTQSTETAPDAGAASQSQAMPDSPAPAAPQPNENQPGGGQASEPQQQGTPATLGTAAAPVENPVGVTASKPAGAVIAPARQRRTRTFAIRIAILVGAAVAVGTVVALANASPNRPH